MGKTTEGGVSRVDELTSKVIAGDVSEPPTWDDVTFLLCRLAEAREKAAEEAFGAIADMGYDEDVSVFGMGVRAAHNALRHVFG